VTDMALPETFTGPYEEPTAEVPAVEIRTGRSVSVRWLEPASLVPTYVGIVVIAVGFALIGVAWAQIAAQTDVALQMPYLVSAGFTGLGLVMLGIIVVSIAAKRQDGAERARQMQTLTEAMEALREEIAHLDDRDE
jgi:hypothetical protein